MEVSDQLHATAVLTSVWNISAHWVGRWVTDRTGLDVLVMRKWSCSCRETTPRQKLIYCIVHKSKYKRKSKIFFKFIVLRPFEQDPDTFDFIKSRNLLEQGAWSGVVVTSRRVPGSITGHWEFFPSHQTVPCALGSTQPLKMSTRIFLGVKTAGV
jgi:hypothetical protein